MLAYSFRVFSWKHRFLILLRKYWIFWLLNWKHLISRLIRALLRGLWEEIIRCAFLFLKEMRKVLYFLCISFFCTNCVKYCPDSEIVLVLSYMYAIVSYSSGFFFLYCIARESILIVRYTYVCCLYLHDGLNWIVVLLMLAELSSLTHV